MAKNRDVLPDTDLSECNKRDINLEDDTEDYIQGSQPLSFQSSNLESASKRVLSDNDMAEMSISTIDETLPFPKSMMSTPFGDVSRDFIPESENPVKRKIEIAEREEICKKRLNLDESSLIKETPDMFSTQSQLDDTIDASHLKVPETPLKLESENVSLVHESPARINETLESEHSYTMFSENHKQGVLEETTAEELLNDESYVSENSKNEISELRKGGRMNNGEKTGSDAVAIDSSSKFANDSGMTALLRSGRGSDVKDKIDSQATELDDTVDAEDIECCNLYSSGKSDGEEVNGKVIPLVTKPSSSLTDRDTESASTPIDTKPDVSRMKSVLKNISDEELARLQKHSTPENPMSRSPKINESESSIENGTPPVQGDLLKCSEINFTVCLQMDCQLIMDPVKGEPVSKKIVNVKELLKRQPKQFFLEPNSDSPYKTKVLSSSSSGSVYSDKTGLPYALPSRSLPASVNSSSSSVDLAKHIKIVERQAWLNEYKIPMAMDEIVPRYVEQHKMGLQTCDGKPSAKRKMSVRLRKKSDWSHPLDNVLESSVTEQSSPNNSDDLLPGLIKSDASKPVESAAVEADKSEQERTKEEEVVDEGGIVGDGDGVAPNEVGQSPCHNESTDGILSEGLLVFARWTDKRYYPGVVRCKARYDRWEVKFDDDTEKVIREDLIIPLNWLTKGELVFALAVDKYMSGKIADIIREEEIKFKIELDDTNEEVVVKKCDICLNEVMAGIIREKFKPSNKLIQPLKSCDIDVDNVLTGKRVREQRTPIRGGTSVLLSESSTAKKRKGGLRLSESVTSVKETPVKKRTPITKRVLNSEKKTRSSRKKPELPLENAEPEANAPSTTKETPVRSDPKSVERKRRARTLKYDSEEPELSNKKLRKSETATKDVVRTPVSEKKSKTVSVQAERALEVVGESGEKGETEKSAKKTGKSQKGKGEKGGGRVSTRSGRGKQFAVTREVKKKKKNS